MTSPLIGITTSRAEANGAAFVAQADYVHSVVDSGGVPVLLPVLPPTSPVSALFGRLDGILLTGGGDVDPRNYGAAPTAWLRSLDAERDSMEIALACWAAEEGKPLLGICRGLQVLNVALGGTLHQDLATEVPGALQHDQPDTLAGAAVHHVRLIPTTKLESVLAASDVRVNSSHHQAVKDLAPRLRLAALAPDGIVEGVELPSHPFALAVQWHPERLPGQPEMQALFRALTQAARR